MTTTNGKSNKELAGGIIKKANPSQLLFHSRKIRQMNIPLNWKRLGVKLSFLVWAVLEMKLSLPDIENNSFAIWDTNETAR